MSARHSFTRFALTSVVATALAFASAGSASAQDSPSPTKTWEFRVTSGAFVPIGDHRMVLDDAHVTAAQVSWLVQPRLALTGTFAWARSRDIASTNDPKLDVFSSDIGVEARFAEQFAESPVTFSPFVGLGAGARSYNYRKLDVDATNNVAGYASVGGELGMGRVGLRLEVRNYVAGFRPLVGAGGSEIRNDVTFMIGMRFDRR
jgi:hypothetical protein